MKMLGLNPMEQEIVDSTNKIVKGGFIYFPEFCQVVHNKFREADEDLFRQNMFKVGF
jgi:Ca2+-binding EF-hand superfamily protein